jgi:hypothetical protein
VALIARDGVDDVAQSFHRYRDVVLLQLRLEQRHTGIDIDHAGDRYRDFFVHSEAASSSGATLLRPV